jgi:hypothetical protein
VHVDAARPDERGAAALLGVAIALHAWHEREQIVPVANRDTHVTILRMMENLQFISDGV